MKTRFLSRFTPSMMSHAALEAVFVQREPLLQEILDRIRISAKTATKLQTLLVGPRGVGKTHLLSLVYHRVRDSTDMSDRLLIAWLREEEWGVSSFRDFVVRTLRAMNGESPEDWSLEKRIESIHHLENSQAEPAAIQALKKLVQGRTLLLLVENLDELLRNLGQEDQRRLLAFLRNNPYFCVVATATTSSTRELGPGSPFSEFFDMRRLDELTVEDAAELIARIARYEENPDLAAFAATPRGRARLRALRCLAGGNHRAFVIFSQLLLRDSLDELIDPLMRTIDDLTPYYNARIAALASEQRKIVEFACEVSHPIHAVDAARGCFITPEEASVKLSDLETLGYLHGMSIDRDTYYELHEPLMRLAIEVKKNRGKPIRLLLDFLRLWYSPDELRQSLELLPPDAALQREYAEPALQAIGREWRDPRVPECCDEYQHAAAEGNYVRALSAAEELSAIRGRAEDDAARAWCLTHLGRHEEAAVLYDHLVVQEPDRPETWHQRAWALFHAGRLEDALAASDRSIQLDPYMARPWCCRTSILIGLGRLDEAAAASEKAISLDEKDPGAWTSRGSALAEMRRYDEAAAAFTRVVEMSPNDLLGYHYLCAALVELKRYQEALSYAKRALDLDSSHPVAWLLHGLALAGLEREVEALESFDKSVELGEDTALVNFKRAELLFALNRWRAGAVALDAALGRFSEGRRPDAGNTEALIRNLFASRYEPKVLLLCIKVLLILYRKHNALGALGHGLIECIPDVAGSGLFGDAAAHFWRDAWKALAGGLPEFRLPLHFLEFAIRFRETQDLRMLMELPSEERTMLESMIGIRVQVTA